MKNALEIYERNSKNYIYKEAIEFLHKSNPNLFVECPNLKLSVFDFTFHSEIEKGDILICWIIENRQNFKHQSVIVFNETPVMFTSKTWEHWSITFLNGGISNENKSFNEAWGKNRSADWFFVVEGHDELHAYFIKKGLKVCL